jgi:preprotein translocase subunit SecA
MSFDGSGVVEIRFSERPRFGLNAGVSDRPQYEWIDKQLSNKYNSMVHVPARPVNSIVPVRNSKTDPKIQRNDPCPCGSGKKFKQCCISKP